MKVSILFKSGKVEYFNNVDYISSLSSFLRLYFFNDDVSYFALSDIVRYSVK